MTLMKASVLPLRRLGRGKVRDIYEVDDDRLLLVATDRVSAFDVVMREAIPYKGAVLTQISAWWFGRLTGVVPHHLISANASEIAEMVPALAEHRAEIEGRSMLCRRTEVFPVECVVRGYISGSAWKEYSRTGTLAGEPLPQGLRESDRLAAVLFSPATKAEAGHDENITIARMRALIGDAAAELEQRSRMIYERGRD
ncbi:MAG TPA: phosphoribosylaminoimidazolesuccinocarboxamide synthase, partial [Gemmatimonadaceae bacterium]